MQKTVQCYQDLMVDLYDDLFMASDEEYQFYRYFMYELPGPALELACGTGQFMLTYREEGFAVDGVDSSQHMLDACQRRANQKSVHPPLYRQAMQDLDVPHKYSTLYIPSCSFMLITNYDQAKEALKRFYEHLAPGGQLLVPLFIPWYERHGESATFKLRKDLVYDERRILFYDLFNYKPIEQLRHAIYRFELYDKLGCLKNTELYDFYWRWYGRYEFEMLLEQAGFSEIAMYGDYTLNLPLDDSPVVIFRARKSIKNLDVKNFCRG